MLEDRILFWRFNHGRLEVLHLVYEKYKTDLLTLAMALLGDLAAAEDVVQDVFLSLLKALLEHKYIELGRTTIDGAAAWGIQVSDPRLGTKMGSFISGGMFDQTTVQRWVGRKHELPIRIDAARSSQDGRASMELVYDSFQWDIQIEPTRLTPQIPDDYELVAQAKWEAGEEGEEIIEVLRLFVEFADGVYPPTLKTVTVANALAPAIKKRLSAKPSKELIARLMKVDMVGMMYTTLEKEGKDPAYLFRGALNIVPRW